MLVWPGESQRNTKKGAGVSAKEQGDMQEQEGGRHILGLVRDGKERSRGGGGGERNRYGGSEIRFVEGKRRKLCTGNGRHGCRNPGRESQSTGRRAGSRVCGAMGRRKNLPAAGLKPGSLWAWMPVATKSTVLPKKPLQGTRGLPHSYFLKKLEMGPCQCSSRVAVLHPPQRFLLGLPL